MTQRTRSERRHEHRRIFAKRYRQNKERPTRAEVQAVNHAEWVVENARARIHTGRQCSCYICANARSKYGNSRAALTFQELIALDHLKERE